MLVAESALALPDQGSVGRRSGPEGRSPRVSCAARLIGREGVKLAGALPLLVAVGFAGGGCADLMTSDSLAQDVAQLQQDVSQLKLSVQRGRSDPDALARLERASRDQGAESARQMTALSTRVDNLNAELSRLTARLDQVSRRLEGRRELPSSSAPGRRAEPPIAAPAPPLVAPSSPKADASSPSPSPASGATQDERYQAAYLDFTKGHYALAIPALRDFVRRSPNSPLADSAQCAIGDSFLGLARESAASGQPDKSRQEMEQAVQEFRRVLANYPRGAKAPTALYKEAVALTELQQTALAQARFKYLLEHFPQSEEAPLAKERLATLSR